MRCRFEKEVWLGMLECSIVGYALAHCVCLQVLQNVSVQEMANERESNFDRKQEEMPLDHTPFDQPTENDHGFQVANVQAAAERTNLTATRQYQPGDKVIYAYRSDEAYLTGSIC